MIQEIIFKQEDYKGFKIVESLDNNRLSNINKINIFIGQNNSGKSRFLRTLFSDKNFDFNLFGKDLLSLKTFINDKSQQVESLFQQHNVSDANGLLKKIQESISQLGDFYNKNTKQEIEKIRNAANLYINTKNFTAHTYNTGTFGHQIPAAHVQFINSIGRDILVELDNNFPTNFDYQIGKIYVPILRGSRPIQLKDSTNFTDIYDNYKTRTINDYFDKKEDFSASIYTGLGLYNDTKKMLLGKREGRDKIKEFEDFLSKTFFDNNSVSIIPDIDKDVLLIGIGESERPVYDYGDGIQAIITLLYPLFFNQDKNPLVFLEEPENFLHPGMQRIFIETLLKEERFKNFQFFITTHSNHFLDLSLEYDNISIYTFHRDDKSQETIIENVSNNNNRILDLLGVRNSSIFLSNCTIWVEGITDRLYIKKFIELLQNDHKSKKADYKILKEDLHYSFIEYAGSNITHYAFESDDDIEKIKTSGISNKVLLIADCDDTFLKTESSKAQRLKKFEEQLGNNFIKLPVREIENLLDENTILRVVSNKEKIELEKLQYDKDLFIQSKYKNEYLGKFITDSIKNRKMKYEETSGTLYDKLNFCKKAISSINSYNELTADAKILTEKIFAFISKSNK
jgi:predicted ATP-dependent endonuclease of OLD family